MSPDAPSAARMHAMAAVRWLLLALVTAVATVSLWRFWGPVEGTPAGGVLVDRYWCPMHPQIRSPAPGVCPICHMALVPMPTADNTGVVTDGGRSLPVDMAAVTLTLDRVESLGVTTAAVTAATGAGVLRVPAVVEAREGALAEVHVRSPGFIEGLLVRETGVRVAQGQVLARVYSPQVYAAQEEYLTARRWAGGSMGDGGGGATDPVTIARAGREGLLLLGLTVDDVDGITRSGTPLRDVPLRAPAGGWVTRRSAVLGMYATPETVLYELADLTRVWAVASLAARDVGLVGVGTVAHFVTPGGDDLGARVERVEPAVSLETRTVRVRLSVANPGLGLRPGQWGEAVITPTAGVPAVRSTVLTVPREAVVDTGTETYVFVDRGGGRFEPRRVRAGAETGDVREVLSGLSLGDTVVTRGGFLLDAESRLRAALTAAPGTRGGR